MTRNKAARDSGNCPRARLSKCDLDKRIISEYDKGTRWAAYAFAVMFAFLLFGVVAFGW